MSGLLEKVRSRGYWRVVIRPGRFVGNRIASVEMLAPLLHKSAVRLRGWDYPHVDYAHPPQVERDWIGQQFEWEHYLEVWRFYQSGQFIHYAAMPADWRDQSHLWPAEPGWQPGVVLDCDDALLKYTEIFELAARLAGTDAGDDTMHVAITVGGLRGRRLWGPGLSHALMLGDKRATIEEFPYGVDVPRAELIARPAELALAAAAELFGRFGWVISPRLLRDAQRAFQR